MAKLEPRVGCIAFSKDSANIVYVLMIYSNYSNRYEFPRGGINKEDSSLLDVLKREFYEETGIDLTPHESTLYKSYTFEEWHMTRRGIRLHFDVIFYSCFMDKMKQPNPKDKQEVKFAKWIPLSLAMYILLKQKSYDLFQALLKSYALQISKGNIKFNIPGV